MHTKTFLQCNQSFQTKYKSVKFCGGRGSPCSKVWLKQNGIRTGRHKTRCPIQQNCPQCNGVFYKEIVSKFCSQKCYNTSKKGKPTAMLGVVVDRSYMKTPAYSLAKSKPNMPAYRKYAGRVHRLTAKVYEEFKHEINPDDLPRTRAGIDGGYQLDHKMSIRYGFDNGFAADKIAAKENLQMLPWHENLKKSARFEDADF